MESRAVLAHVLNRIPLTARIIVEIGCRDDSLARHYHARNPRARYYGVGDVARQGAASALHEVAPLKTEGGALPFAFPAPVDCLIYNNALQDFDDPAATLAAHVARLAPDGLVLVQAADGPLPGIAATRRLASRDWVRRILAEAGLHIHDGTALPSPGIDADAAHYVWRAGRQPARRLQVAAHMLPPQGGVSHVRIIHPLEALASDPDILVRLVTERGLPKLGQDQPRVLVVHRLGLVGAQSRAVLRATIEDGWIVITEFDDHPDFFARMESPEVLSFRGVHAIQTSTPALAEVFRTRNPHVAVFPNAVRALPEPRNFQSSDRLRLFFGAFNREADWRSSMPVLARVAQRAGARLHIDVMHDRAFFDALPGPHKTFHESADYDTYLRHLAEADLSFMPLAETGFNRAKSDLKFLEASAARLVTIASRIVYEDSVAHGETGFLFGTPPELEDILQFLLADPREARRVAEAARAEVAGKRMLAYQVADRVAWYRHLWERRRELTADLLARAPELAG